MEQEFSLTSELRNEVLIITTSGYINNVGGEAISNEFSKHFPGEIKNVVINLAGSKVVNSIGMSHLIDIIDQLNDAGGKLVFCHLDTAVEKMLNIMGLFAFAGNEK
ncbi:MAG: STAS domain-containing protein, partial [bacterium]